MTGVVVTKLAVQRKGKGDHWYAVLAITGPVPGVGSTGKQGGMFLIADPTGTPAVEWIGLQGVTAVKHEPSWPEGEAGVSWV